MQQKQLFRLQIRTNKCSVCVFFSVAKMRVYILFALGMLVNYSQSPAAMPLRKVLFPGDYSDESDDIFSPNRVGMANKTAANNVSRLPLSPKIRFRLDAGSVPCSNETIRFCERVDQNQYPTQHVKAILQKNSKRYENFFNNNRDLSVRDDFAEPINLCETYTRQIYPQIAMNINSDWRFIINQPEYRQSIRVELCQKRSSQCQFSELFPLDYVSSCTQKFTKIPLLSLDDDGEVKQFDYEFPSHCQCDLQKSKTNKKTFRP